MLLCCDFSELFVRLWRKTTPRPRKSSPRSAAVAVRLFDLFGHSGELFARKQSRSPALAAAAAAAAAAAGLL